MLTKMVFTSSASVKINVIYVVTLGYNLLLTTSMTDFKLNIEQFYTAFLFIFRW